MYIEITCPICNKHFVDIPLESMDTSKASKCKNHLDTHHTSTDKPTTDERVCVARNQTLLEQLSVQKQQINMQKQQLDVQERQLAVIRGALEISDNSSDEHHWKAETPCANRSATDLCGKRKSSDDSSPVAPSAPPPRCRKPSAHSVHGSNGETTIYVLIDTLLLKPIYTGKTGDADRRLGQHQSDSSSCRLVAQFVRKHGRARVGIRPLVRCSDEDADTNESFYILKNNTLYPDGLNLRHGSMAGAESDECTSLAVAAAPPVSETETSRMMVVHAKTVASVDRDVASAAAAWADVAAMCAMADESDDESSDGVVSEPSSDWCATV